MFDPSYPAFPVLSFLGFVLVLIPLPWHLQAWNAGTCLYMIWTAVGCLNLFINSIVWSNDAINRAPVWCDISTRIIVGIAVAIPAASLCINRRLYKIATVQSVSVSRGHKRRAVMVDLAIGLGIPIAQMVLQYVVEGHRFNLWEQVGCYPATYNTPLAYPLSIVWPCVIGLISAVYCVLTLRAFMKRRAQFSDFVNKNSSLTVNRYFRLMALATTDLLFTVPLSAYSIYLNVAKSPIYPWISFADTHGNYSHVDQFPAVLWRSSHETVVSLELSRWLMVVCAFVFFFFFGFADEARRNYKAAYWAIAKRLGMSPPSKLQSSISHSYNIKAPVRSKPTMDSISTLPVYMPRAITTPTRSSFSTRNDDTFSSTFSEDFKFPATPSSSSSSNDSHGHLPRAL
ncbi:hypothetical protein PLICRDRAFT_168730 [Plicaturopsis crispa FD-325 SS-3]|uniref:Uncharacterized protein n=1 Tax=Plicaturopsis crispa FD-325 SS-3 TaxID=944288 RepID=A0A0C9SWN5_PLICR|nr:hypothetical protein PLICRDRAFT_168730 [Plicaturopsis crispa FD-325 SS-3]